MLVSGEISETGRPGVWPALNVEYGGSCCRLWWLVSSVGEITKTVSPRYGACGTGAEFRSAPEAAGGPISYCDEPSMLHGLLGFTGSTGGVSSVSTGLSCCGDVEASGYWPGVDSLLATLMLLSCALSSLRPSSRVKFWRVAWSNRSRRSLNIVLHSVQHL